MLHKHDEAFDQTLPRAKLHKICARPFKLYYYFVLRFNVLFLAALDDGHIATAGIAASLAVLVVIIIVFTGVAIVYYK